MQEELTITEIAARLRVSERTALRRIEDGDLSAERRRRNRYLVEPADIEALAPRSQMDARTQEARITALEEQVQQLARQIADIQAVGSTAVPLVEEKANRPRPKPTTSPASLQRRTEGKMSTLADMAKKLRLPETTLRRFIFTHDIEHTPEPKRNKKGEQTGNYTHYFTPEQEMALREKWNEINPSKPV